jgi:capsular polysaccharide biosynthesis protein
MAPSPPRELLFLSRRDAKVRLLLNEREIEAALAPLGFVTVVPGEMSVREQVWRFSNARVIVGAHGASFGNLMWAPAGAKVLEIVSGFKSHILDFPVLARCCDLQLVTVVSDDYDFTRPEPYRADVDFSIDVDVVLQALRGLAPELF